MRRTTQLVTLIACVLALGCDPEPDPNTDAGGDTDASTTHDAGQVVASDIRVTGMGANEIANGGRYEQITLDGIPPYSQGIADITVTNVSGEPLTVHSVTLTPVAPTEAYEWALNEPGRTMRTPLTVSEVPLADSEGFTFGLFFYPLASGQRDVEVTISYGDAQSFTFTAAGRGRDNATFSPVVSNAFQHLFGRSNEANSNSFQPGGLAADSSGNVYFNGNVNGWNDVFGENLVMVRVAADGSLSWVRELQEQYPQESRDIADNQEIGGGQDSLDVDSDGNAYIVAERAIGSNQVGQAFIMQLDGASGDLNWARGLNLHATEEDAPLASQVLRGQSVDASLSDRVLFAGQVADSSGAFLAALDKSDGSLLWARTFAIGGVHRVGSLVVDVANDRAYLAGIAANAPFAARIDGVSGSAPTLAWSQSYSPGFANVHSLALDGDNLLAAIGVRGAITQFVGARLSTTDGSVVWAKVWDPDNSGDNNNTVSVAVHDGLAIFSGRIAFTPFDTASGEGFLLALDPATGAYEWGSFYYGGKGTEEIVTDYVTGLVSTPAGLWVLHQQTPGSNNMEHFWGRWYQAIDATLDFPGGDGSERLADFALTGASGGATLSELAGCTAHAASAMSAEWVDVTSDPDLEFEDPLVTEAAHFRTGTHALLQRVTIAE